MGAGLQHGGRTLASILAIVCGLACVSLAADLPRTFPVKRSGQGPAVARKVPRSRTSQVALFENNDPAGAARLAAKELRRHRRNPKPWFVAMEAAALTGDGAAELRAALALCGLKMQAGDPRVEIAAAHVRSLAGNTEAFRSQLQEVRKTAASASACAEAAQDAIYAAALDGLPGLDARESAARAGYLMLWTLLPEKNRAGAVLAPNSYYAERLEFPDSRVEIPEYLPASLQYSAESEYRATEEGDYEIRVSPTKEVVLLVDGRSLAMSEGSATVRLTAGSHLVRLEVAGSRLPLRVRVVRAAAGAVRKAREIRTREAALIAAELSFVRGDLTDATARLQQPVLRDSALAQWLLSVVHRRQESANDERFALRRAMELAPQSMTAESRLAVLEALSGNNDVALSTLQRASELRPHEAGAQLALARAAAAAGLPMAASAAFHSSVEIHPSCSNVREALEWFYAQAERETVAVLETKLEQCAPGSRAYAEWLRDTNRHSDAGRELQALIGEWPFDRRAYRELIAELQRSGVHAEANRVAAELVGIAPNTRAFRRMAGAAALGKMSPAPAFYEPYRRTIPSGHPTGVNGARGVLVLQDKVAVARQDGSVSVYVHRVLRWQADRAPEKSPLPLPASAQVVRYNVVTPGLAPQPYSRELEKSLKPGDVIDQEYVLNYVGEGGMIGHPEAFQYVFHDFDYPLLEARFVVLTPIAVSPGYVIASGQAPPVRFEHHDGFRAEIWDKPATLAVNGAPAVIRVVENENGWSIPPSVERRRIIETIHKGPRPKEA